MFLLPPQHIKNNVLCEFNDAHIFRYFSKLLVQIYLKIACRARSEGTESRSRLEAMLSV